MNKLILIMIDGISSDHFERYRQHLPHLDYLAKHGTQLRGLSPEVFGTSAPGRTSIICASPSSEHGIYGNFILADGQFRYATPYDVKVATLPQLAKQQGRDVACLGYGMVRPEDCHVYQGPWWVDEMIMRARDDSFSKADQQWQQASGIYDPQRRLLDLPLETVVSPNQIPGQRLSLGMLADQQLIDKAAALACSAQAPDLILLEIAVTDYFLHQYGTKHDLTNWSLRVADAQIGTLLSRLRYAERDQAYHLVICSDHGHAPVKQACYVDRLLAEDVKWSSEGSILIIHPKNTAQARTVTQQLLDEGFFPYNGTFCAEDSDLLAFCAPLESAISFESAPAQATTSYGPSKYRSNHGMTPGSWPDYRFCLFSGPEILQQHLGVFDRTTLAMTLAEILGIDTPWQAESIPVLKNRGSLGIPVVTYKM